MEARRIMIYGATGSGKSMLARRSGEGGPQVLLFSRQTEVDRWLAGKRAGAGRAS